MLEHAAPYRKMIVWGLVVLFAVDLLELVPPLILKAAVDQSLGGGTLREMFHLALAYLVVMALQGFGRYGWRILLIRSSMLAGRDLRERFAKHLQKLEASFYDKNRIGDLMSHSTQDTEAVRMALGPGLLTFADAIFYFLTVPVAMFLLSPKLTLLSLIPLPLIPLIVSRNEKLIHKRFGPVQNALGNISSQAQEGIQAVRVIKAFGRLDEATSRMRTQGEDYRLRALSLSRVQSAFGPSLDFFMSLGLVILLYFGGGWVMDETLSLGTFVAFQRYIQKLVWPMTALGLSVTHYQRGIASSDRLKAILAIEPDVTEPKDPASLPPSFAPTGWRTPGRLEWKQLSFSYPGTKKQVLHDFTLTLEPGMKLGVLGRIGSGKTTLLALLPRVYPIEDGKVFLDSIDLNRWPLKELRRQIGLVSQEVFLFSDTVLENVTLGLEREMMDHRQIRFDHSTKLALIQKEIESLSFGRETLLGERGVNLSGGQKQRMTLARALAKDPSILLLDDALSSVDIQTEEQILEELRRDELQTRKRTRIFCAHRISTLRDSDWLLVLDQGRIIDQGTHASLMKKKSGFYFRMYEQQRLEEDLLR
jgi:ATP-binding cassette subfamily B protein